MALDSPTEKLAMLHWEQPYEASLPLSPSSLGQDDQQQLLWGYPGILWSAPTQPSELEDLNTLFIPYVASLRDAAAVARPDSDSLVAKDLPTVQAAVDYNDLNTEYAAYLS